MLTPARDDTDLPGGSGEMDFSTLLASTIHDLKNSVGSLLNTLNDSDTESLTRDAPTYAMVTQLQHQAVRINNDLMALLAVYKIDHDRYTLDVDHHNVYDVIEECVLQYTPLLRRKGVTVETLCPEDLYWFLDRSLTTGIINNAINNALRHTRDRLVLQAETHRNGLTIQVQDNGPGYPEHLLTCSPPPSGGIDFNGGATGLGLYFAAQAARQHKNRQRSGHITLGNGGDLGGGRFSLHLP